MTLQSGTPSFSIVIPTRHRPELVRNCLQGVVDQEFRGQLLQVMVVDNGDFEDGAKAIVESFSEVLPVSYHYSTPPGVSRARNLGLQHSRSAITVFIDDDEIPRADWFSEMAAPFTDDNIRADIVAGNYSPLWEVPRPDWLIDDYMGLYSVSLDYGDEPRFLNAREWVLEGNIGVKTELLKSAGGFDESLGREGGSLISGEGIIYQRLVQAGARLYYNPNCLVNHLIHPDRLNKKWLQKRMFAAGMTHAMHEENGHRGGKAIPPISLDLGALARVDINSLDGDRLLHFVQVFEMLGYVLRKKNTL